jgi:hypothetical protein
MSVLSTNAFAQNKPEKAKEYYPKEVIWTPGAGAPPKDYYQMVVDTWISQLEKAKSAPHHFYNEQYISLKVSKSLRNSSKTLSLLASTLIEHKPSVASEWCEIPYIDCLYNVSIRDVPSALERLKYFRTTYLSLDNYCTFDQSYNLLDADDRYVSGSPGTRPTDEESLAKYKDSIEACHYSGPIVFGKCLLYSDRETNGYWYVSIDDKDIISFDMKSKGYKNLISNIACRAIPGG